MVPVGSSIMLELVLAVHSYHVIAYPGNTVLILELFQRFIARATENVSSVVDLRIFYGFGVDPEVNR